MSFHKAEEDVPVKKMQCLGLVEDDQEDFQNSSKNLIQGAGNDYDYGFDSSELDLLLSQNCGLLDDSDSNDVFLDVTDPGDSAAISYDDVRKKLQKSRVRLPSDDSEIFQNKWSSTSSNAEEQEEDEFQFHFESTTSSSEASANEACEVVSNQDVQSPKQEKFEPMESSWDTNFANGCIRSMVRRGLSDIEKKRQRALRFGETTNEEEQGSSGGATSSNNATGGHANVGSSPFSGIEKITPQMEANMQTIGLDVDSIIEDLENNFEGHRSHLVTSNGLISTPLHALKECARFYKEPYNSQVTTVLVPGAKSTRRAEITVGRFRGVGEALDLQASLQMAALDILQKIQAREESNLHVVPYGLLPGWRISARVVDDLNKFCRLNQLQAPRFDETSDPWNKAKPLYHVECFLGSTRLSQADSDVKFNGMKLAAALALEKLTEKPYPKETVSFGASCMTYKDLVRIGYKPEMTTQKRNWLLQQFADHGDSIFHYGADKDEFEVLQRELHDVKAQEEYRSRRKRSLQVTVVNDVGAEMPDRKIARMVNLE